MEKAREQQQTSDSAVGLAQTEQNNQTLGIQSRYTNWTL